MKTQLGFSLIEMMVVVAIIGIIASIAVPIFSDYQTRSKVTEALNLTAGLKTPATEFYLTWGRWPAVASLNGKSSGLYTSLVQTGTDTNGLYIEATMKGPGNLSNTKLRIVYNVAAKEWTCTTVGAVPPIPNNYLPASCK